MLDRYTTGPPGRSIPACLPVGRDTPGLNLILFSKAQGVKELPAPWVRRIASAVQHHS